MQKRTLGKLEVSALGLGCMSMSEFYGPTDDERSNKTIQQAIEMGLTFFDTADMYGSGHNEEFLGRAVKKFRDKIILATKFGIIRKKEDPSYREICGKPEYVKKQCENSLKHLNTDTIDLYYQHRLDPDTPIEETVGAMAQLVNEGKIRHVGLSEVPPDVIRRAHAIHPITALQTEYSLWSRGPEAEILKVCKELNIGFVAYSPLGRGFLTGRYKTSDDLHETDFRRALPRFQGDNFEQNLAIVQIIKDMALHKKCTASQIALAWVLAQSPHIVPIFGTTRPEHLKENLSSLNVHLSHEELRTLNEAIPKGAAKGNRYPESSVKLYDLNE